MEPENDAQLHAAWVHQGQENRELFLQVSALQAAINDALALDDVDAIKARLNEAIAG